MRGEEEKVDTDCVGETRRENELKKGGGREKERKEKTKTDAHLFYSFKLYRFLFI